MTDKQHTTMHSCLRKVTPLSKYLAMVLFVALPFIGAWIGYQIAPKQHTAPTSPADSFSVLEPIPNDEASMQALMSRISESDITDTTFAVTGTYTEYQQTAWGTTETCYALTLPHQPQNLLHLKYLFTALGGNSVNTIDNAHRLVINLPWSDMPDADKETIKTTPSSVTLKLKERTDLEGRGVGPCFSFFTYQGLK